MPLADRLVRLFLLITVCSIAALLVGGWFWTVHMSRGWDALGLDQRVAVVTGIGGLAVAIIGVAAAIITYALSARAARAAHAASEQLTREQQRREHTFTMLLETRLSSEFRETVQRRRAVFPEYMDLTFADWDRARRADALTGTEAERADARRLNEGAWALITLLNYYEFLALGIETGDLDEDMLFRSVRGIMCSLVDDARYVVAELHRQNRKTFAHLIPLYARWRIDGATDTDGKPNERPIPVT